MKFMILFSSFLTLSFAGFFMDGNHYNDYDYKKAWKEVEQYMDKGLPKSALSKVDEIYQVATKSDNDIQIVKSTVYRTRLILNTKELGLEKVIAQLNKRINEANHATRHILQSLSAELIYNYYRSNYYIFKDRTDITEPTDDIRTWSPNNYRDYITSMYIASLAEQTKKVDSKKYIDLIPNAKEADFSKRPTLYLLLADRAIRYFENDYIDGNNGLNRFYINGKEYFQDWQAFVRMEIPSQNKSSFNYKLVSLYQDILPYIAELKDYKLLANYDIVRLRLMRRLSETIDSDKYYLDALQSAERHNDIVQAKQQYGIAMAKYYLNKDHKNKALVQAEKVIEYATEDGILLAKNIIKAIKKESLNVVAREVYTSSEPINFQLLSANMDNVYFRIVSIDVKDYAHIRNQESRKKYLNDQKAIIQWSENVINNIDIDTMIVETNDLDYGYYGLITSTESGAFFVNEFWVSDIAYSQLYSPESDQVIIRSRQTGEPIEGAVLHRYSNKWINGAQVTQPQGKSISNKDGIVNTKLNDNYSYYITFKNDYLDLNNRVRNYKTDNRRKKSNIELFTDRSIYRPGQTVYFKGIAMSFDNENVPQLIKSGTVDVELYNANNQKSGSIKLNINDFGSFSGSLVLPKNELTGYYKLSATGEGAQGSSSFNVEEYKRPKFEITFDESQDNYRLGDTINVEGKVTYFTGAALAENEVHYRVYKQSYPTYRNYHHYHTPYEDRIMIDQGVAVTEIHGNFNITFDTDDNSKNRYSFIIEIVVTDKNGETQESQKIIDISPLPYTYKLENIRDFDRSERVVPKIYAINNESNRVASKAEVILYKMEEPPVHKLYSRYPNKQSSNDKEKKVINKYKIEIDTNGTEINLSKLEAGMYLLEIKSMEDYSGEHIKSRQEFVVTDFKNEAFPINKLIYTTGISEKYNVGEKLQLNFGTSDPDLYVRYYLVRGAQILDQGWMELNSTSKYNYTITDKDIGGLDFYIDYAKNNYYNSKHLRIEVPWDHKKLNVKLETVRDITEPGSKEKWKIIVKSQDDKPIKGELLASMYDASLDNIKGHGWSMQPYPNHYSQYYLRGMGYNDSYPKNFNYNWNSENFLSIDEKPIPYIRGLNKFNNHISPGPGDALYEMRVEKEVLSKSMNDISTDLVDSVPPRTSPSTPPEKLQNKAKTDKNLRVNLKELVFFYPHIETNEDGSADISFTMNDALTSWKFMALAHDSDLRYGLTEQEIKTQKDVMVLPNGPRFFREGDQLVYPATVFNLSDKSISVKSGLELTSISDSVILNDKFKVSAQKDLIIKAGESQVIKWKIDIPVDFKDAISLKVWVEGNKHYDAQVDIIPIVTNQKLITHTKVIGLKSGTSNTVEINELYKKSATSTPHSLIVEYTSNPLWYAVQALPSIVDTESKNILSLFNDYYGHELAAFIAKKNPRIKEVISAWEIEDADALNSNLEKNLELKYSLLKETPWVRNAQDQSFRKRKISTLFIDNNNTQVHQRILQRLKNRQNSDGGFSWYPGGKSTPYVTQYILEGIGHLIHLGALDRNLEISSVLNQSLDYVDRETKERFNRLKESIARYGGDIEKDHLDYLSIHYLYARRYFDKNIATSTHEAYEYYYNQAIKYWLGKGLQAEAMIGMVLKEERQDVAIEIKNSLEERSFYSEKLGRYWNQGNGYRWYDLPIETHAMMIEFFNEMNQDIQFIEDAKIWLIKNKQTNDWKTSKASAAAIYALLVDHGNASSDQWLTDKPVPIISVNGRKIDIESSEIGTGYIKIGFNQDELDDIKSIGFHNKGKTISYGAVYYQYFEELDAIKSHRDNPLNIRKTLYKKTYGTSGEKLIPITANHTVNVGDEIISRIEIKTDRSMDFVHLEDMRPSGFEPTNELSGYKYGTGFRYYESIRDLSSNYFIVHLPKGTYVFESSNVAVHKGMFSTGIATIQNIYAPEFTSYSDGIHIEVE